MRTIPVQLDPSTLCWLTALAQANNVTPERLLERAAYGLADYAGRKPSSTEAAVCGGICRTGGHTKIIGEAVRRKCLQFDAILLEQWKNASIEQREKARALARQGREAA